MNSLVRANANNAVHEKPQQWNSTTEQQAKNENEQMDEQNEQEEYYNDMKDTMAAEEYYRGVQNEINKLISDDMLRYAQSEETEWYYSDGD